VHQELASAHGQLEREFRSRTPQSNRMHARLSKVLPGGETRSITHFDPYPIAIQAATGCTLLDVDGNQYIDVLNNYTSLVHGHGFAPTVEAIARAAASGVAYPAPHAYLLDLAELLIDRFPALELVRFTNSGTEATMLAIRLARRYTGRSRLVLFEEGYHGAVPQFMDQDSSVVRVPYNDVDALRRAVDTETAAVFVEPFLGSGGVLPADPGFLEAIRSITSNTGALMVLDEVQSLRSHYSGVHGALGLVPDLVLMGKIIGGGTPVGAVGGKARVLLLTASGEDRVLHSGTFNGNPLTMAAGLAAMRSLDTSAIELLNARAVTMASAIEEAAAMAGVPAHVTRAGSILHVHPGAMPSGRPRVTRAAQSAAAALHLALLLEGVYAAPRGMLNISTALSETDAERVVAGYRRAFAQVTDVWVAAA
jgi:glutamate-1-semialdehyde 2,1-aminomutase